MVRRPITARSAWALGLGRASGRLSPEGGTDGEPVDGVRGGAGGRACALRAARGRGRAWFKVGAAGDGVRRSRPGGPDPAARADRRALGVVHRPRAGQGERPASRGGVHIGHGGGELPPGRDRGRRVGHPAAAAHRRPAAGAARHRGQPDRRPDQAVRFRGPLVRRVRRPRAAPRHGRTLALAGRPRVGARGRRPRHPARPGPPEHPAPRPPGARRAALGVDCRRLAGLAGRTGGRRAVDADRRRGRRRGTAGAAVGRAGRAGVRRRRLRRGRAGRSGRAGGLAGAGRAVVRGAARAERPRRLPVPARVARVHGSAPAERHHLGRPGRG